jgi:endonuclease/exonuclease/phosphatase family metal-dependent hydrolase
MSFRVATFNMQNGQPWSDVDPFPPVLDLNAVVGFLKTLDADILCLQEVEQGHDGGMQVDPPPNYTVLRKAFPGYDSVFSYPLKNDTELPFGLGLAIFSRTKLTGFQKTDLPAAELEFEFAGKKRRASPRLLLEVLTTLDGRRLRILNTHLQAFFMIGDSSNTHSAQRDIVESKLREFGDAPLLLAGDMNSAPDESLVEQFQSAGFHTVQNEEITWRRMPFVTDHIFYNPPLRLVSRRIEKTTVSDHHAVVADFEFV